MNYGGIDNGVSGTIGILTPSGSVFTETPAKKELNYTKNKSLITRIDSVGLKCLLEKYSDKCFFLIERPMVNPKMFKATISAVRALEATLNVIEILGIPYQYIDSKEWQKNILPSGIKGRDELKLASMNIGYRLFPEHHELITKNKDADGLLIAEYCKRLKQ